MAKAWLALCFMDRPSVLQLTILHEAAVPPLQLVVTFVILFPDLPTRKGNTRCYGAFVFWVILLICRIYGSYCYILKKEVVLLLLGKESKFQKFENFVPQRGWCAWYIIFQLKKLLSIWF